MFLLRKNAAESVVMMKTTYKEHSLSKTQVHEWFARFKKEEMTIGGQPRCGPPSSARNEDTAKSTVSPVTVDIEQSTNSKTYSYSPESPFSTFCTAIWECD